MIECKITKNYFKERERACKAGGEDCEKCDFYAQSDCVLAKYEREDPQKAIELVQRWSDAHQPRTRMYDLLEKHPNAPMREGGIPSACAEDVGYVRPCPGCSCSKCWNTLLEDSRDE